MNAMSCIIVYAIMGTKSWLATCMSVRMQGYDVISLLRFVRPNLVERLID